MMTIPGNPLPISPALWTDLNTGRPTDQFYNYVFKLDNIIGNLVQGGTAPFSLLNTLVAANSASLDDTTSISSTYNLYMIALDNLAPIVNTDDLILQYRVSGAFAAANYSSILAGAFATGAGGVGMAADAFRNDGIMIGPHANTQFSGIINTGSGLSGMLWLHLPNGAGNHKHLTGSVAWESVGAQLINSAVVGGTYIGSTAIVTGIRVKFVGGNINFGNIRVYGLKT